MRKSQPALASFVVAGLLITGATSAVATEFDRAATPAPPVAVNSDYLTEEEVKHIAVPDAPQTITPGVDNSGAARPNCIVCGTVPKLRYTIMNGPVRIKERWAKHLTPVWANASSYTWSKTTTISATLSTDIGAKAANVSSSLGLSASRSKSWSVGITVPASSSRYSKLSLLGDYQRRYIKKAHYNDKGTQISDSKYSYLYSPTATQYIKVTYKS